MATSFSFLKRTEHFVSFTDACIEAEESIKVSPPTTAILARRALELAVKWLYSFDSYLEVPYRDNLSSLIYNQDFKDILTPRLPPLLNYVRRLGNVAVHTNDNIKREEAIFSLKHLHQFVSWIAIVMQMNIKKLNLEKIFCLQIKRKK